VEAPPALLEQFVVRGRVGLRDGGGDPAARLGDFLIARPSPAHRMFVRAGAPEHQMSVTVDQAGGDPCTIERIHGLGSIAGQLRTLPDTHDLAVGNADRPISDDA
jgi:hypothetical protein